MQTIPFFIYFGTDSDGPFAFPAENREQLISTIKENVRGYDIPESNAVCDASPEEFDAAWIRFQLAAVDKLGHDHRYRDTSLPVRDLSRFGRAFDDLLARALCLPDVSVNDQGALIPSDFTCGPLLIERIGKVRQAAEKVRDIAHHGWNILAAKYDEDRKPLDVTAVCMKDGYPWVVRWRARLNAPGYQVEYLFANSEDNWGSLHAGDPGFEPFPPEA